MEAPPQSRDYAFWAQYPGIVWSNPDASDSVMIANALLQVRTKILPAIAARFGWHRIADEWAHLKKEAEVFPQDLGAVIRFAAKIEVAIAALRKTNV